MLSWFVPPLSSLCILPLNRIAFNYPYQNGFLPKLSSSCHPHYLILNREVLSDCRLSGWMRSMPVAPPPTSFSDTSTLLLALFYTWTVFILQIQKNPSERLTCLETTIASSLFIPPYIHLVHSTGYWQKYWRWTKADPIPAIFELSGRDWCQSHDYVDKCNLVLQRKNTWC